MNLRRWDRIVIVVGGEFHTAIVWKVGQQIRCEYGYAFSNFGPVFYDLRSWTVRRRDEGLTWVKADDPVAVEAMKAARALR